MLTIYGSPKTSAGRCFWTLEEVGKTYEMKSISFKGNEHKSEAFLKINPAGKIPAVTDGDFTIWESVAINQYLAESYMPELAGKDAKQKALANQWSIWSVADLQPPIINIFIQLVFVAEERRDNKVIEKASAKLPALFEFLDNSLGNSKYLLGDEFTLADLNASFVAMITEDIKYDISEYKNVMTWLEEIKKRDAFKRYKEL